MPDLLVTRADVGGDALVDIRVTDGRVAGVGPDLEVRAGDRRLDAAGGAVLPGLHDHHLHLCSLAAVSRSIRLGPPEVKRPDEFATALRSADRSLPEGAWIRAVAYDERVAGDLDRHRVDAVVPDRPVRIQHRTGARWVLNSAALDCLPPSLTGHPGVERDGSGAPTGRLTRMDERLGDSLDPLPLCLAGLGAAAARHGVTGFTDATPAARADQLARLATAAESEIPQRVTAMTAPGFDGAVPAVLTAGPVKVLLDDDTLPRLDELVSWVQEAHRAGRGVAFHCVTRVQLAFSIAALDTAGAAPGDRVEHGSVIPPEAVPSLRRLGVTVVTNPGFLFDRGDDYLERVEACDRGDLYRCGSLLAAGVSMAAGTDAPFGPSDPWAVMRACVTRTSRGGQVVGPGEGVDPRTALSLFLGPPESPGRPRRLRTGTAGDLCVLFTPMEETLRTLDAANVAVTVVGGEVVADNR